MPKKPVFPESNNYVVFYMSHGVPHWTECIGAKTAVETYRMMREMFGDEVRLARVVLNYGAQV